MRETKSFTVLAILFAAFAAAFAAPAGAATISVNINDDETASNGNCSLREAITAASLNLVNPADGCTDGEAAVTDFIELDAPTDMYAVDGTGDNTNVTGDLDIIGQSDPGNGMPNHLLIRGDVDPAGAPMDHIVKTASSDRVLHLYSNTLAVDNVIVENGAVPNNDSGGGIYATGGGLTVRNSQVRNNDAGAGGGIATSGQFLAVVDSVIGGGAAADGNAARSGGGIWASGGMTLLRSRITSNFAVPGLFPGVFGAGVETSGSVGFSIADTTIAGNTATPGAGEAGTAGGTNFQNSTGTVSGSTISGNSITGGNQATTAGVRVQNSTVAIVNSTISENTIAAGSGSRTIGGLLHTGTGTTRLIHSTVAANSAPQDPDQITGGASVTATGSVIDQAAVTGEACFQPLTAGAYNVESGTSCLGNTADTDVFNSATIGLAALGSNGGPTLTRAIGTTSSALDLVPAASCLDELGGPLLVDQRGAERPFGANCDAGAFERVTCGGFTPGFLGGPGDDTLTGLVGTPDSIVGSGGNDTIDGRSGDDFLCGGSGNDTLTGSEGQDEIFGDAGDDTVLALDGVADTIDCGPGQDSVTLDLNAVDTATGCEVVTNAPPPTCPNAPGCGGGGITPPPPPPPNPTCKKPKKKTKAAKKKFKKCKKRLKRLTG